MCLFNGHTEPKKVFVRGLMNFISAVAYLFCLNLPAAFSQPHTKTFFGLCSVHINIMLGKDLQTLQVIICSSPHSGLFPVPDTPSSLSSSAISSNLGLARGPDRPRIISASRAQASGPWGCVASFVSPQCKTNSDVRTSNFQSPLLMRSSELKRTSRVLPALYPGRLIWVPLDPLREFSLKQPSLFTLWAILI